MLNSRRAIASKGNPALMQASIPLPFVARPCPGNASQKSKCKPVQFIFSNALRLFAHFFMKKRYAQAFFGIFIKKSSDFFLSIEKV